MSGHIAAAGVAALLLAGCSIPGSSTPTAAPVASAGASAAASATTQLAGSVRTVLAQLGLNVHATPSTSAPVIGSAEQGTQLTVLGYQAADGGWFKVQGQTTTGWIVADPALTAAGSFTTYSSTAHAFSALYPDTWTFAEAASGATFLPQQGSGERIVVRTAAAVTALGQEAQPGYALTFSQQEIMCGYTGSLDQYTLGASPSAAPSGGGTMSPLLAIIRLVFDSTHAIELRFEYTTASQLDVFADFYHSIAFPYPLCEAPQAPAPSPT